MCIYQLKIDSADEGEVIRWFSRKTDAQAAVEDHAPFGGCAGTWGYDFEIDAIDVPTKKAALIDWLNANVRAKRTPE
jgi:hypothetical protein